MIIRDAQRRQFQICTIVWCTQENVAAVDFVVHQGLTPYLVQVVMGCTVVIDTGRLGRMIMPHVLPNRPPDQCRKCW